MPRPDSGLLRRLVQRIDVPAWQSDARARPTSTVREVFTGDALVDVPVATTVDVADAFARARRAQPAWAARPVKERAAVLARLADLVHARRADLLDIVQAETGKNRLSALDEVMDVLLNARYYAAKGPGLLRPHRVTTAMPVITRARVHHRPLGVVGIIGPWNYPLALGVSDGLAALLAGNAVVLKPATLTPLSALFGADLLVEAGLPRDLWQVMTGAGREAGAAIVQECDFLMFTGASETGATLAAAASRRLVPFSAELGGKNPMIVGAGADLAAVADIGVRACFASAGQLCVSIERIYVEASIFEAFCETFVRRVEAMRVGPGYGWTVDMGSLASAEHLAVVQEHVRDALAKGARLLTGGRRRPDVGPTFYEPTVLTDVPASALCAREETFGPVVSLYRVESLDAAVAQANDSSYGLASAVFCATSAQGEAVAALLRTGMVSVNEGYAAAWSSLGGPAGGMGISGLGYRHGREGLLKYTHAQTVATQTTLLNFGGPRGMDQQRWASFLEGASNLVRLLPGRWPGRH
ncbi:MAG: succinic semialdehyde dehydrogenase [Propionibacteriaceae bacterium]|nr:succinate-semialdehyde dehydrogenase (NADP(+)) [Micropruina sp.]HBX81787.1 succinic semialdehyde dehydrogenase [Propionibacteriaceae bacterium]HBY24116.1 succinic semialdehyde dehydrogenase [Propionibacteriaceae bacterium]